MYESESRSVVSTSLLPWTVACRLLCPWNSPGQNTGVGSCFFSRGSSQPRDWTQVSCIAGRFFIVWATREGQEYWSGEPIPSPADLYDTGIETESPAFQVDSLPAELPGKSKMYESFNITVFYIMQYCHPPRNLGSHSAFFPHIIQCFLP